MADLPGMYIARDDGYWWSGAHKGAAWSGSLSSRFPGDPGTGSMYFGLSPKSGAPDREPYLGHRIGVSRTYWNDGTSAGAVSDATTNIGNGTIPWPSFKLQWSWANFANGAGDAWFSGLLSDLDNIGGGPILLTLHHEPNGDGPPASDYLAMYLHAKTMTDSYPQILLAPILSAGSWDVNEQGLQFSDWMSPESCDVFAFDTYNYWSPTNGKTWTSPHDAFYNQARQCLAMDATKPWAVGEWGVRSDTTDPGKAAGYMSDAYDLCLANGCLAMAYFDSSLNAPDGPWDLEYPEGNVERLDEFKALTLDSSSVFIPAGGYT